jgi:hypothetical protein
MNSNRVQERTVCAYPFEWVRIQQAIKPNGPFARSTLFELLRKGVIESKTIQVGQGNRKLRLISLRSLNAFLGQKGKGA